MIATLLIAAVVAQPTTFRVDAARAEVGFELKATMHTVHGRTNRLTGELRAGPLDDGSLALSGHVDVDAATLDTGNQKRDATMHGTSLDVAAHPSIVFEPERFAPSGPPGPDGKISGQVTGRLTIRGTTRPATIAASLTAERGVVTAEGSFDVTWADFGVPDPSFFFVRIERVAHAHFRAAFVPLP